MHLRARTNVRLVLAILKTTLRPTLRRGGQIMRPSAHWTLGPRFGDCPLSPLQSQKTSVADLRASCPPPHPPPPRVRPDPRRRHRARRKTRWSYNQMRSLKPGPPEACEQHESGRRYPWRKKAGEDPGSAGPRLEEELGLLGGPRQASPRHEEELFISRPPDDRFSTRVPEKPGLSGPCRGSRQARKKRTRE